MLYCLLINNIILVYFNQFILFIYVYICICIYLPFIQNIIFIQILLIHNGRIPIPKHKTYLINNSDSEIMEENKKRQLRRVAKKYIVKGDKLYFNAGESQPLVIKECELQNTVRNTQFTSMCGVYI